MGLPKQTEIVDDASPFGLSDAELLKLPTVYRDDLFKGRVVLVSGAGSGLGKAIAVLFARLGATLMIAGRDGKKLERAAALLSTIGNRVVTHAMTIRDPEQVSDLIDRTWSSVGPIDVLINNAGGQFP